MRVGIKFFLGTVLIIGILLGGFTLSKQFLIPYNPATTHAEIILIPKGKSPTEIARELQTKGIIENAKVFLLVGKIFSKWEKVKAGEYRVSANMSSLEILSLLASGQSVLYPITIREGENMYEVADSLEKKELVSKTQFLSLCTDPHFIESLKTHFPELPAQTSLEGYLYPDTYSFSKTNTPEEMIKKMVAKFVATWKELVTDVSQLNHLTPHQLVTLASMIEKETGAPHERPLISSVFYNRLRKKMRLQSDPTIIYGIWKTYRGNLKRADLTHPTPYNTYTVSALPVGPIGNPGKEALMAALKPAESDFLYFVSHNDGTHEFTKTFNDHNEAVKKYQLDRKARIGKSWRDLSKKSNTSQN